VVKAITPQTRLIHTESPSNPRMRISDLRALAQAAKRHNVLLSVDSTMMPPVICKPLTLGADVVIHSATKFFSGHADCTGGLVCVRDPELAHRVAFLQNAEGTALAPFECFLFLRGIKTMHLRVQQAQQSAVQVAAFLMAHPQVREVYFPGKGGCSAKGLAIHRAQATGQGSMISFVTGSVEFSRRFCDACRIFKTTVSFGSVNSLCEMPCTMSHASIPSEKRTLPDDLVRLSIGIEDVRDLISDLSHALAVAAGNPPPSKSDMLSYDSRFEDLPVVPDPGLRGGAAGGAPDAAADAAADAGAALGGPQTPFSASPAAHWPKRRAPSWAVRVSEGPEAAAAVFGALGALTAMGALAAALALGRALRAGR